MVFMVLHGFSWFFMVFHGSILVFHGSKSVFMFFFVPGWFSWFQVGFHGFSRLQVGFHGFSWFQVGFSCFLSKMYLPELYPGPTIQSRSAARRAAKALVHTKRF